MTVHRRRAVLATALGVSAAILLSEMSRGLVVPRIGYWPAVAVSASLALVAAAAVGLTVLRMQDALLPFARHDLETEGKYRALLENIPDVAWTVDEEHNVRFVSPAVRAVLGYTPDEILRGGGRTFWRASLHPDEAARVTDAFDRLFAQGEPFDVECRVRRKDGQWIWVHNRATATYERGGVRCADGLMADITARKRTEEALLAKEAEYRRLVGNLPDVTWSSAADGRTIYISPNVERVFGYTAEEMCERGEELWLGRIDPLQSPRVVEAFQALFSDNRPFDVEYRIQRKDGEWIWVHDRAIRTYSEHGARFADGVFSDVTARKRLEEALKETGSAHQSPQKDRLLAEEVPALTYMLSVGPSRQPIYVSPQATALLGFAPEERKTVPELWCTLVHPEDRARVDEETAEAIRAGRRLHLDYRLVGRDGRVVWVHDEATLAPAEPGRPRTLRGVLVDISDVKAAEEALQESERRYRLLAENVSDVIWTADLDLRRTYVSPSVTRVLGYAPDELVGQSLYVFAGPAVAAAGRKILEEELAAERAGRTDPFSARVTEVPTRRKDGSTVWVEVKTSFIRDRSGRPVGILGMTRDITERRQAEQAKSDFITFATHQLRTPLTGIKWLLEIAALQPDLGADMSSYLSGARASADRMIALVNDLLDATRLERRRGEVKTEPTDLVALTHSLLEEVGPLAQRKGQRLTVRGADTPVIALAEPALLRQAVINLVSNAIKFTPDTGTIDIRLSRQKGEVRWEIQDSGIGIPEAAREHLFEKFYRADNAVKLVPEGTGLGLHLARLIIDQFGGRLWFVSEENLGTTFTFTLPTPKEA